MRDDRLQMLKTTALGMLVILLLVITPQTPAKISKGKAPDFTLKSMNGENIKLSEYRGEVVMLNFWASWSSSSRQEMPLLNELYKRYKGKGFTLFGVNVAEDPAKARQLLRDVHVIFPILMDTRNIVSEMYKVEAMPSTIILDRDGNMRYMHRGYEPGFEDEYQKQVRELMRE